VITHGVAERRRKSIQMMSFYFKLLSMVPRIPRPWQTVGSGYISWANIAAGGHLVQWNVKDIAQTLTRVIRRQS
jgi:hypothetical protein